MRVLIPHGAGGEVTDDELERLYAVPADRPWLRVNMVDTLDGAAQGDDGRSGGINNAVDRRVFGLLRRLSDCLVVGAGTVRAEGYRPADVPVVVVTRSGVVPPSLRAGKRGAVLLATVEQAPGLAEARELLGDEHVLVLGTYSIDLARLKELLAARGWTHVLSEGGPHLLREMLAARVVDELCLTTVPRLIAGEHLRITHGPPVDVALEPTVLLEQDGTLLGRWRVLH